MKSKILLFTFLLAGLFMAGATDLPVVKGAETNVRTTPVLGQNYPNPAKAKTVINVDFTSGEAVLSIYNVLGKLVEEIVISGDRKVITLDVSDYKEGIYLYTLEADGQKVTRRMTVSK